MNDTIVPTSLRLEINECFKIVREHIPNCFFLELFDTHEDVWTEARVPFDPTMDFNLNNINNSNLIVKFKYGKMDLVDGRGFVPIHFPDLEKHLLCFKLTEIVEK